MVEIIVPLRIIAAGSPLPIAPQPVRLVVSRRSGSDDNSEHNQGKSIRLRPPQPLRLPRHLYRGSGNGQGIYLYQANSFTGTLELVKVASTVPDPSFLCASASGKFLYATNEISNFNGGTTGSVTSSPSINKPATSPSSTPSAPSAAAPSF